MMALLLHLDFQFVNDNFSWYEVKHWWMYFKYIFQLYTTNYVIHILASEFLGDLKYNAF
jgi:hypothetical protein